MKVSDIAYHRFDVQAGTEKLKSIIARVKSASSAEELLFLRNESIALSIESQSMNSLSYIRFSLNTEDSFYLNEKSYYDENMPVLMALARDYDKAFLENPYSAEAFSRINPNVRSVYELSVKVMGDEIIQDLVEEARLVTEYDKLMSEMEFSFKGKRMPLSVLRRYFEDKSRKVRRGAMEAAGNTMSRYSKKLDGLFNKLVCVRNKMAKKLGFSSYSELGDGLMGRYSYGRAEVKEFRKAVVKYVVPAVSEMREEIAENLGLNKIFLYDTEATLKEGNPEPYGTAKDLFEAARKMYSSMGAETKSFFEYMLVTDAFDVFPKKGKWGGGYCTSIDEFGQPFILANFNGSSGDVDVLTHETGHAFAYYEMFKNGVDYELGLGTMSVAEIHSMAMELLAYPYAELFFKDAEKYKYCHLVSSLNFIPYGTMVDEFQEICYDRPEMTCDERNKLWLELEKKYRPYMTSEGIPYFEKGTRWQYQMHIYESPMYYIDYCLSQTVAHELYALSRKDYEKAFAKYVSIVKTGGEKSFEKLVTDAGLGSPFDEKVVRETVKTIQTEIEKLKAQIEGK